MPFTERNFPIHDRQTAPEAAHEALDWYQSNFQMVPYLAGVLAESPALLNSYWQTQKNLLQLAHLSGQEVNIVETVVAHENRCQYCVAGHTAFGKTQVFDNTDEQLNAIRSGNAFLDPKLDSLREFTLQVLRQQGRVSDDQFQAFTDAGYHRGHALDVVACVAAKVMSNFANQLARTPLDQPFAGFAEDLPYLEDRPVLPQKSSAA